MIYCLIHRYGRGVEGGEPPSSSSRFPFLPLKACLEEEEEEERYQVAKCQSQKRHNCTLAKKCWR